MKSISPALAALLATGQYVSAELWTLTLVGGAGIRWSGAELPISFGGQTWVRGPAITRSSITEKVGSDVSELDVDICAGSTDFVAGVPVIRFIAGHGLDGANLRLDRIYGPAFTGSWVGTLNRFTGRVTAVQSIKGGTASITASDWRILLNNNLPRNFCQVGCLNTLYDGDCGLNPSAFQRSGTVTGTPTASGFVVAGFTATAGYFALGRIVFTSGVLAGISRTIRNNDGSGNFTFVNSFPGAPAAGDTFTAFPGCDHLEATCLTKFNNKNRFRGTPFVPQPTTAIGSPASSTTTRSGK